MTGQPPPWDINEVTKLGILSGRPLEVRCAQILLQHEWNVSLASYFIDGTTEKLRELDVLAEKRTRNPGLPMIVRVFLSAKGFPEDSSPVCYVIGRNQPFAPNISLMSSCNAPATTRTDLGRIAEQAADHLLIESKLANTQEVTVGLDTYSRKPSQKKKG